MAQRPTFEVGGHHAEVVNRAPPLDSAAESEGWPSSLTGQQRWPKCAGGAREAVVSQALAHAQQRGREGAGACLSINDVDQRSSRNRSQPLTLWLSFVNQFASGNAGSSRKSRNTSRISPRIPVTLRADCLRDRVIHHEHSHVRFSSRSLPKMRTPDHGRVAPRALSSLFD